MLFHLIPKSSNPHIYSFVLLFLGSYFLDVKLILLFWNSIFKHLKSLKAKTTIC